MSEKIPNVKGFDQPRHLTNQQHLNYLPWIHTIVAQIIFSMIFSMYVATTLKLWKIRNQNMQSAIYISDTPVTLKQGQGHQTYNDNVYPKHGYNSAKFERSCFHGVWEKANIEFCYQIRKHVNHLPWKRAKA